MTRLSATLAHTGFVVASACAAAALAAGLGHRYGLWHYRTGIAMLGYVFWVATCTAIITLVALAAAFVRKAGNRSIVLGALGVLVAGVTAYMPYHFRQAANGVPAIHDITTDLANPPAFVRAASLRGPDDHPVAYDGAKVGELQKAAYPDISTIVLQVPAPRAFEAATAALKDLGLEISDFDPAQGRIEAVATSLLFGFKDDVVVRVAAAADGTRIDVRSKSRVGKGDVGARSAAAYAPAFLAEQQRSLDARFAALAEIFPRDTSLITLVEATLLTSVLHVADVCQRYADGVNHIEALLRDQLK